MESIISFQGKLSPENIEAILTALNGRYKKEMVQHSDHHAEDYEPYEGYPDGKDLYEAYIESTPEWNAQFETPEYKMEALALELTCTKQMIKALEIKLFNALETVEFHVHNRIDRLQESVHLQADALVNHLYPKPDDYDTQEQVEEYSECSMCSDGCFCDEQEDAPCMIPMFLEDEPQEELPTEFWSREL